MWLIVRGGSVGYLGGRGFFFGKILAEKNFLEKKLKKIFF